MKRLVFLCVLTVLIMAIVGVVTNTEQGIAERPTPTKSQQTFRWSYLMPDSSTASYPDTSFYNANTSTPLLMFDAVDRYSTIFGYYVLSYDTAAATIDTTMDTVWVEFFTAADGGTPWKAIYSAKVTAIPTFGNILNASYIPIVFSDSILYDYVYARIITAVEDTNIVDSLLPLKLTVKYFGK